MKNNVALVTGGTSGIGKEIVKELLKNDLIVYAVYLNNDEQCIKAKAELAEYQDRLTFIKADVSQEAEVKKLFSTIEKLDYLVNNAGINVDETIEQANLDSYLKVINTNLIGKMLCIKYAIPLLRESNDASIINISSSLGVKPTTECSAYCCAASAIHTLTMCAALELADDNIRVNTISPAFTPTPLSLSWWTPEEIEEKKKRNPRHRLGKVEDIANVVLFLLSDKANYINGENIRVNGGSLLK